VASTLEDSVPSPEHAWPPCLVRAARWSQVITARLRIPAWPPSPSLRARCPATFCPFNLPTSNEVSYLQMDPLLLLPLY